MYVGLLFTGMGKLVSEAVMLSDIEDINLSMNKYLSVDV